MNREQLTGAIAALDEIEQLRNIRTFPLDCIMYLRCKYRARLAALPEEPDETNLNHKWEIKPSVLPYPVCRVCGIVQRRDGKNSPCKGPVSIGLRDPEEPDPRDAALEKAEGWVEDALLAIFEGRRPNAVDGADIVRAIRAAREGK